MPHPILRICHRHLVYITGIFHVHQATIISVLFITLICVMHGIWCKLKSDYHIRDATHVSGLWFTPGSLRLPLEWLVASKFDKFGYPDDTPALAFPPGRHPKPWEPVAFGMSEVARAAGLSVPRPVRRGLKAVRRWASFERGDGGEGGLSPRSRSPRAPRRRPRRSRSFESVLPRSAASSSRSTPPTAPPPPPPSG